MPYKRGEEPPDTPAQKMSEETRREIFENEKTREQRGDVEGPSPSRQYRGPSESGGRHRGIGPRGGG